MQLRPSKRCRATKSWGLLAFAKHMSVGTANCEILCVENGYCLGIAKTLGTKWYTVYTNKTLIQVYEGNLFFNLHGIHWFTKVLVLDSQRMVNSCKWVGLDIWDFVLKGIGF